jgi:hypothetical protein
MKKNCYPLILASGLLALPVSSEVIEFEISPEDIPPGLSPIDPSLSSGSGNEIGDGILLDYDDSTGTGVLSYNFGYGSAAGFTDLTGPATGSHIHRDGDTDTTVDFLHDLFAADHFPSFSNSTSGIVFGSVSLTEDQVDQLREGSLFIDIHTASNPAGEIRGQLVEVLNEPPTVTCPEPETFECTSPDGEVLEVVAMVADPDGDELTVTWEIDGEFFEEQTVPSGGEITMADVSIESTFLLGTTVVKVTVSDGEADPVSCETSITVEDTTPPEIESITPSKSYLWPPNHKMKSVSFDVEASDICGEVTTRIISIESNEPENDTGDGNTEPDWEITDDLEADLRAERSGSGEGRVYTVTVEATDESGNTATSTATVKVQKSQGSSRRSSRYSRYSRFRR